MAISNRPKQFLLENYEKISELIARNKVPEAKTLLEAELRKLIEASKTIDEELGKELIALITKAKNKAKDDVRLYVQEAMVDELQGKIDVALVKYEKIRAQFPENNHHASLYAARIMIDQKKIFQSGNFPA